MVNDNHNGDSFLPNLVYGHYGLRFIEQLLSSYCLENPFESLGRVAALQEGE